MVWALLVVMVPMHCFALIGWHGVDTGSSKFERDGWNGLFACWIVVFLILTAGDFLS